jgi:hypothetical protein
MLQSARTYVTSLNIGPSGKEERFKFLRGSAEDLHLTVEDSSVDLLIAGTLSFFAYLSLSLDLTGRQRVEGEE